MTDGDPMRPETTVLADEQKKRVLGWLRRRRARCRACGTKTFLIGDALFLGFLFLGAERDAYMIALTCTNRACPAPHTGVTLPESEFLSA